MLSNAIPRRADQEREAPRPELKWDNPLATRAGSGKEPRREPDDIWGAAMEPIADRTGMGMAMPGRAVVVAETLARLKDTWERPEELAHDARNMVTALELYCHLLEEPGG